MGLIPILPYGNVNMLQDQWQADMDKLYSEYETCKTDKLEFEEMVDRLSKEMEERIEGLKQDHAEELIVKDKHIRDLYTKVRVRQNDYYCTYL